MHLFCVKTEYVIVPFLVGKLDTAKWLYKMDVLSSTTLVLHSLIDHNGSTGLEPSVIEH